MYSEPGAGPRGEGVESILSFEVIVFLICHGITQVDAADLLLAVLVAREALAREAHGENVSRAILAAQGGARELGRVLGALRLMTSTLPKRRLEVVSRCVRALAQHLAAYPPAPAAACRKRGHAQRAASVDSAGPNGESDPWLRELREGLQGAAAQAAASGEKQRPLAQNPLSPLMVMIDSLETPSTQKQKRNAS